MPLFTPIGGGGIGKATVTGTTGSPNVDSSTRAGKTIYRFTASGTITVGTDGTAEVLVVGGGGGSRPNSGPGAGAGGYIYKSSYYIPAGTHNVTVGAGGVGVAYNFSGPNNNGEDSIFVDLRAIGGGAATKASQSHDPFNFRGGSGGGGSYLGGPGPGITGQGFGGGSGNGSTYQPGGGGGAGGAGGNGTASPGVGGIGVANSITGTSVTYAIGGVKDSGTVAANRGLGGGGRNASDQPNLCTGGSGVVIIVIG
jgi:hypothetical protein